MHISTALMGFLASLILATSVTPHEQYSSSTGVLGCFMNTDHAAYFPWFPNCQDFCYNLTHPSGRNTLVAHIDMSGGAHDISYESYNYLVTGQTATANPITGGGVDMRLEVVPPESCASLFEGGNVAYSAGTGSAFPVSCPPDSYIGRNYELWNIQTATCTYGKVEKCWLDATLQQPRCPSTMNLPTPLTSKPVYNVQYGTGVRYPAP